MDNNARVLADRMAEALDEKKGRDIEVMDIASLTTIADAFVLCSGRTPVQVRALSDAVEEKLAEQGVRPINKEGYTAGRWIVLDYGAVVAHIFHQEDREFYNLERLWQTSPKANPSPRAGEK
ncbi:MAG: ribosome silencing factor [Eubacteriales bacterium]|nr:ribosome silencing factor [Eubacteriales bacterium]